MQNVTLLYYLKYGIPYEFKTVKDDLYNFYSSLYPDLDNISDIIPENKKRELSQLKEKELQSVYLKCSEFEGSLAYKYYTKKVFPTLSHIEQNGIYVNKDKLYKYHPDYKLNIGDDNLVYSEYNVYTTTGRPSNRKGNINFSALNKDTGERSFIESRFGDNGYLVELDYEAYHLRLLSKIVGYDFPVGESPHQYLARYYGCDYEESKAITFKILYGGIPEAATAVEFFKLVKEFTENLYDEYKISGRLSSKIFKKDILISSDDNKNFKNKLMNYYIQSYEFEFTILILQKVVEFLKTRQSKLILYTYDSILLDMDKSEIKLLKDIINIMEDNYFTVKLKYGKDYHNMVRFNKK